MSDEPTIGKLVVDAVEDIQTLVRAELALAKAELKSSAIAGGLSVALFVVAGFVVLLALILLSIAFAFLLSMTGLHPAWCFLIVTGVYLLLAGGSVAAAVVLLKKKLRAPTQTIATVSKIPSALKPQ